MRYSGIQPQYFPRLHYFARALNTDTFVLRDEVQFVLRHKYPDGQIGPSYQAHCPIRTSAGLYLLNVQIKHEGVLKPINQTRIAYDHSWVLKHLKTIQSNYMKAPYFKEIYPQLEEILAEKYQFVADLNIKTFLWGLSVISGSGIKISKLSAQNFNKFLKKEHSFRLKEIKPASSVKALAKTDLTANEKILAIMKEIGANEDYTGGTAFQAYMDEGLFEKAGVKVTVQDWKCKEYPQLFPKLPFIANLSIIDLLMNVSPKEALGIIGG